VGLIFNGKVPTTGGGSTIPDPDGASAILGTDDGETWVSKPFGDAFLAFVEPNLSDVQGLLGIAHAGEPVVTHDDTPTSVHPLELTPGHIYRFRILATAQTDDLSVYLSVEKHITVRVDSGGEYATSPSDVGYVADGGWTFAAPATGTPHVDILDTSGGAGNVRVTGLPATDLTWDVQVEQLG